MQRSDALRRSPRIFQVITLRHKNCQTSVSLSGCVKVSVKALPVRIVTEAVDVSLAKDTQQRLNENTIHRIGLQWLHETSSPIEKKAEAAEVITQQSCYALDRKKLQKLKGRRPFNQLRTLFNSLRFSNVRNALLTNSSFLNVFRAKRFKITVSTLQETLRREKSLIYTICRLSEVKVKFDSTKINRTVANTPLKLCILILTSS